MRLKFTFLIIALTLSIGFVSAQLFSTDGVYTIQNVGTSKYADPTQGAPVQTNPLPEGTTASDSDFKWIIKENGSNYNIMTLDQTLLLYNNGTRGELTDNTEAIRNSTTGGALVTFSVGNGNTVITSLGDDWNGQAGSNTLIGMGTRNSNRYEWILTRLGDLPDVTAPVLTITSELTIEPGTDITYTSDEDAEVYLVPSGTTGDLAAIQAAAVSSVTTPATSGTLSTTGLSYGDYILYAVDASGNLASSGGTITLVDLSVPSGTVSVTTVQIGGFFSVTITKDGTIYVVPAGTVTENIESSAVATAAATANVGVDISTGTGFTVGNSYDVYAKDTGGNWSENMGTVLIEAVSLDASNVYTFDTDGDAEGWVGASDLTDPVTVQNGYATLSWTDTAVPKFQRSGDITPSEYPFMVVRIRINEEVAGGTITGSNSFRLVTSGDANSFRTLDVGIGGDENFKSYIFDLSHPNYIDANAVTLTQIQPFRDQPAGSYSVDFDEIRFISAANTWDGSESSDWHTAANWSLNKVPTGEETTIASSTPNQPTISAVDVTVASLTLEDGVVLSVSAESTLKVLTDLSVTGTGHVEVASGSSLITYGTVEGSDHVFHRSTTFDSNTGKYSVVGSPVAGASTSVLGSLVYIYDETVSYSSSSTRFMEVSTPETMAGGDAYFSAFTGDVTFTGTPHTGNVVVPLTYDAADGGDAGFNLVSNPYPAAINYSDLVAANQDIDGAIYLWDDGGSDTELRTSADYITVNLVGQVGSEVPEATGGVTRSGNFNDHIGSAQGFFVKANKLSGSLNFTNDMKVTGNNADANYFRKGPNESAIQSVKIALTSAAGVRNESLIGFVADATLGFDRLYDAHKMDGLNGVKLYSLLNEEAMSIQGLPMTDESIIPLGITVESAGVYTLNLASVNNLSEGKYIYLEDTQLDKIINLESNSEYKFSSPKGTDENRFKLIVSSTMNVLAVDALQDNALDVLFNQNGITVSSRNMEVNSAQVSVMDLSGAVLLNKVVTDLNGKSVLDFRFESNRVYLLRVTTGSSSFVSKIAFD